MGGMCSLFGLLILCMCAHMAYVLMLIARVKPMTDVIMQGGGDALLLLLGGLIWARLRVGRGQLGALLYSLLALLSVVVVLVLLITRNELDWRIGAAYAVFIIVCCTAIGALMCRECRSGAQLVGTGGVNPRHDTEKDAK